MHGLYCGGAITASREIPGNGILLMTKDVLERKFRVDEEERKGFKLAKKIVSAGVAGLTAWCISMPLDTVKSIIQSEPEKKKSAWSTALAIYKKKGLKKFYSGLAP